MYVLVWLCLETREAIVSSSTEHPNSAWVVEQTELFLEETATREIKPEIVIHDMDTKFTKEFTASLAGRGVRTNPLPVTSPNLKDHVASCTSFVLWGGTCGKRLRPESFWPWLLHGECSLGMSYRHSCLSL